MTELSPLSSKISSCCITAQDGCHDQTGLARIRNLSLGLPPSLRYPSPSQITRCITRLA